MFFDRWMDKLWYIYAMDYYSVIEMSYQTMKRHGRALMHIIKWMKPSEKVTVWPQLYDIPEMTEDQ